MAGQRRLEGRVALVTGASRGIGAAVARRYAAEGARLVLVARGAEALEQIDDEVRAAGAEATLVPMDLAEYDAIDRLGAALNERFGRLDVLVASAGVLGVLAPLAHTESEIWQQVIDVNLTANWRLIRSCDPLLRASDAGRAIFVTSGAARGAFAYWGPYSASKAALEALVRTYAAENVKTKIRANIVDPGAVRTDMRAQAFPGEDPLSLIEADAITEIFVELARSNCKRNGEVVAAQS